jgi:hypothetical protein
MYNSMNKQLHEKQTHFAHAEHFDDDVAFNENKYIIKIIYFFNSLFVLQCWFIESFRKIIKTYRSCKFCERHQFFDVWHFHKIKLSSAEASSSRMRNVKSSTWNRLCVDEIRACLFSTKSQKIRHADRTTHRKNSKIVCALRACIKDSDKQQVEMRIAHTSDSKENNHTNVDFFAFHCVHIKRMLRTRFFNLFVNHQTRNHLRKLDLIRVARTIEQRQRNDDSVYKNAENRSAYRFKEFSSHIFENFERKNVYSIHSFSFISYANRRQKSINKARTSHADRRFLQSNQE